jgi:hypothetical protein
MKFFPLQLCIIILCLFIITNIAGSSIILQGSPPARIAGSVMVDESTLTQQNASGYTFVVTKEDSTAYVPVAQCETLNTSDWYLIDIPIFHETMEPGGANPGDTAIVHIFNNGEELILTSPDDGLISVGQSGSATQIDLVAYSPVSPAKIYGTLTVDGNILSQSTSEGYSVVVSKQNGINYTPQAICNTLNASNYFSIDIPIFHNIIQSNGANIGEAAVIHIYKNGLELEILSPSGGLFTVGQSDSLTRIDLTARNPVKDILDGPAVGTTLSVSKGRFEGQVISVSEPDNTPANFPLGLIDFSITDISNGDEITVTFTAPTNLPTTCQYYKYKNGNFFQYNKAYGLSDGDNQFSIVLIDGGVGDDDGLANGRISDPGGPGVPFSKKSIYTIPTLSELGRILFIILIVLTGIYASRKISLSATVKSI